ncbi:MFS transporter [Nonomuraea sp. NBC_01738]|uniref:MFS transporter n=1 Tax=Nonomuraea sp. NBC_01738 TaxID=2976003 RepID=UPI002E10140A|nr:MFS transporter [Nonomuraea sp. NBC_01738]
MRVPGAALAVLAGPMSFGIAGPALILGDVAAGLGASAEGVAWLVTVFGWGIALGTPLASWLLGYRGARVTGLVAGALALAGTLLVVAGPTLAPGGPEPVANGPGLGLVLLGRALQALGAAGLSTAAMSLAGTPRRMGLATASLAVVGSVAPLVSSLVAGALGWRAALALPVLSVLAVPALLGQPTPADARPRALAPAALLRSPSFVIASLLALGLAVVNFGLIYALPARFSGWTRAEVGAAMVWPLLFGGALSWFVVAASTRVRRGVTLTALVAAGIAAAVTVTLTAWPPALLVAQAAASLAAASGQGVLAVQAADAAAEADRPAAIGLFTLCYLLGVAFGPLLLA